MRKVCLWMVLLSLTLVARAAEESFDFTGMPLNEQPTNCTSIVAGEGKPGKWKIIMDEVPLDTGIAPFTTNAPTKAQKTVVAQLAEDFTDEHFPMLLLGNDTYGDFTLTSRFKMVHGITEQMAGLAFRVQDEKNYYVVRASALGKNVRFYKVVNGQRGTIIGPDVEITAGVWHEFSVDCRGNQIHILLDGKEIIPLITDSSFGAGKIGYWTKSDSVSYFSDTKITYTPREPFVQGLVRETMEKYPRLLGLQIVMLTGTPPAPHLVASDKEKEIGEAGRASAVDVIKKGTVFWDKDGDHVTVTMPLKDRNGDAQAAVRITLRSFPGQTEENAILRAVPIVKEMQARAPASNDWNE